MIDREQLAEARDDGLYSKEVAQAVDTILEADQTWWCEEHNSGVNWGPAHDYNKCDAHILLDYPGVDRHREDCRIVTIIPVVVVPVKETP